MKTNDSAGRFVGDHHQVKLYHSISQPPRLLSTPIDQFLFCQSLEFSTIFWLSSLVRQSSSSSNRFLKATVIGEREGAKERELGWERRDDQAGERRE